MFVIEMLVGVAMFGISESQQDDYLDKQKKQMDENKKTADKEQKDNTDNLSINNTLSTAKSYKPPGR